MCLGFAESLSLHHHHHHHPVSFSWKPLRIITWHSHISLGLDYDFAGCRMLDQYVDQGLWLGHLSSFYPLISTGFSWFTCGSSRQKCLLVSARAPYYTVHTPDLSQKVQERGGVQIIVLLCLKGTSMGRVFGFCTWRMVQSPSLYAPRKNPGGWRRAFYYCIFVWAKLELLLFGTRCFWILSGVWGRIKIQLSSPDHLPLVYLRVGIAGDTRKGNLMESLILGDCWCHSKYTSSPLSLSFKLMLQLVYC